ncbi:16S rRNA (guanine(966)-N(2))-methyltransferase RsmD [Hoyosella subflava]|uniref:Putative methyltransferase n=1 Tax=Hoyosella subflava (strain DSM 45089 / JCM 17490 / NBRC 109087 / DQS3-9A1) TaxID=443218 RepID=F6EMP8_HOYSD|nr:16S rRNA (guanine(966)-N(2))-methyltransferase RsmD [Hoyosella subflava]AEF41606.1 putative methyltransferase [Hoyosella subflava DQS3-9A1]
MTRIIAGGAGGIRLRVPPKGTRPTTDRVREALFSALSSRIDFGGLRVLDLYAGSGALGLESLSRGAAVAVFVESGARAVGVIKDNIQTVRLPGAEVIKGDVTATLGREPAHRFSLVFADPPYTVDDGAVAHMLTLLVRKQWLAPDALVVIERSSRSPLTTWPEDFEAITSRKYGETRIDIAQYQ